MSDDGLRKDDESSAYVEGLGDALVRILGGDAWPSWDDARDSGGVGNLLCSFVNDSRPGDSGWKGAETDIGVWLPRTVGLGRMRSLSAKEGRGWFGRSGIGSLGCLAPRNKLRNAPELFFSEIPLRSSAGPAVAAAAAARWAFASLLSFDPRPKKSARNKSADRRVRNVGPGALLVLRPLPHNEELAIGASSMLGLRPLSPSLDLPFNVPLGIIDDDRSFDSRGTGSVTARFCPIILSFLSLFGWCVLLPSAP